MGWWESLRAQSGWYVRYVRVLIAVGALTGAPDARAESHADAEPAPEPTVGERVGRNVAAYLPNRFLDLFDIVRVRVRFGPGGALAVRCTKYVRGLIGSQSSLYMGLAGPRGEPTVLSPVGFEHQGEILPLYPRASSEPYYGPGEVGFGFQLGVVGFAFGVDPVEAADFATGFLFIDFLDDDY